MSSAAKQGIILTVIAGVFTIIGAVVANMSAIYSARVQAQLQVTLLEAELTVANQQTLISTGSNIFGEIADLMTYFEQNPEYTLREARTEIGKARRAIYSAAAYLDRDLAGEAVLMIETMSQDAIHHPERRLQWYSRNIGAQVERFIQAYWDAREGEIKKVDSIINPPQLQQPDQADAG